MRPRMLIMADRAAPALTGLLVCSLLAFGTLDTLRPVNTGPYFERIAATIDALPIRIGEFVGAEAEVTPSAIRLLKPNRLLQRSYVDPWTGRSLTLLVVHCGNVRDMAGHYPPNCYPAHGWKMEQVEDAAVEIGGSPVPAKIYEFSQRIGATEARMHVLNFFVLPSRTPRVVADIGAVDSASASHRAAGLGAAQVQIVATDRSVLLQPEVLAGFMGAIEPSVNEIAKGPTSE